MPEILSQEQIDELLNALNSGEVDVKEVDDKKEKKVKKYDFRRPEKFAKEQLRAIEVINENLARLINNSLNGYLRTYVEVNLISTESLIFSEFSNSISTPAIIGILDFYPLEGQIVIDLGLNLGYTMVEKLLGGQSSIDGAEIQRALTEIEEILITNVYNKIIDQIVEAWSKIIELEPKLTSIETNPQFVQIMSPSESIALITFEIKIGNVTGMMNVAMPYYVLEPIMPGLSSKLLFGVKTEEVIAEKNKHIITKNIQEAKLPLNVKIGNTDITLYELVTLCIGDVLVLDTKKDDDFDVYVSDELKFKAKPGVLKNKIAVKITKKVEEGES